MKKYDPIVKDFPHFLHGGDYNPEQWIATPEIWDEDMRLMKEANCNEMTVGIHAWPEIEIEEGVFDFSFLDTILDKIHENGAKAVLATPSAARPIWLVEKYPDVMRVMPNGVRKEFSSRMIFCWTSPIYREKVRIINEKLAERYANHPAVVAWHLSNEYSGACYCDRCKKAYQNYLAEKYDHDIEKLNQLWWSRFWGHRYQRFDQIVPPRKPEQGGDHSLNSNRTDWKRFISDSIIDFAKMEADTIRKYSDKPITTNCMNTFPGFDHHKLAKILDVYSNDVYPQWQFGDEEVAKEVSYFGTLCRGMLDGKPYMVMESAPGINMGDMKFIRMKADREQLMEAMLLVSSGADTLQYFQWRKGRNGYEKFHGAVVDHYGKPDTRVFQNVKKVGEYLKKIEGVIGTGVCSDVAIVYDYETRWALSGEVGELRSSNCLNGHEDMTKSMFYSLWSKNICTDIISYETDFSKYKVVCLPVPYLMDTALADKLKAYVQAGGILVTTYLTAVTDWNELCHLGGVPGAGLRELFGLRTEEVTTIYSGWESIECKEKGKVHVHFSGKDYSVEDMAERIIAEGAETIASFDNETGALHGMPAVLKNNYGKGTAYYIAFKTGQDFMKAFWEEMKKAHGVKAVEGVTSPDGAYVTLRQGDGEKYFFALNCSTKQKTVVLDKPMQNLLDGNTDSGTVVLEPYGMKVYFDKE